MRSKNSWVVRSNLNKFVIAGGKSRLISMKLMRIFSLLILSALPFACGRGLDAKPALKKIGGLPKGKRIEKSDAEWKKQLTAEEYYVLRQQGTERPFTGKYHDHHEKGIYLCAACRLPLFSSATKFDSGTGWPSFFAPVQRENVEELADFSHGMTRTEVRCGRCGGHLGHVFDDGPRETGLRYCINSAALIFTDKK